MTEYVELYSREEKQFYKNNKHFFKNLRQMHELKPFVISNPTYINDNLVLDNIDESCILLNDAIYYDQCIFDKFIKLNYQYEILNVICDGKIVPFYQIVSSDVYVPVYCFYFNLEYIDEYGFLSHYNKPRNKNEDNNATFEIKLVKKINKSFSYSTSSLFTNIYNKIDKFCIVKQNESVILVFEENQIFDFQRIESNTLHIKNTPKMINGERVSEFEKEYSFVSTFNFHVFSNTLLLLALLINNSYNLSLFNTLFIVIFFSGYFFINYKIKSSKFIRFLEEHNCFSPVKSYYKNTFYNNDANIENVNYLKYM